MQLRRHKVYPLLLPSCACDSAAHNDVKCRAGIRHGAHCAPQALCIPGTLPAAIISVHICPPSTPAPTASWPSPLSAGSEGAALTADDALPLPLPLLPAPLLGCTPVHTTANSPELPSGAAPPRTSSSADFVGVLLARDWLDSLAPAGASVHLTEARLGEPPQALPHHQAPHWTACEHLQLLACPLLQHHGLPTLHESPTHRNTFAIKLLHKAYNQQPASPRGNTAAALKHAWQACWCQAPPLLLLWCPLVAPCWAPAP